MSSLNPSTWDYTVLTRWSAQVTKGVSNFIVPSSAKTNPAFVTFQEFLQRTENLTLDELKTGFYNFPSAYHQWWMRLWEKNPVHLFVETLLIAFIFWLMFIRKTVDPKKKVKDGSSFTRADISNLASWVPEPLVPELTAQQLAQNRSQVTVTSNSGDGYFNIEGVKSPVLNLSSYDYLGLGSFKSVKASIQAALDKYGCGSCGPRGFYGTIDVHLDFETEIAKFMGTEEAIAYSDSASGVTSTISAFAKRGDVIIMDEACHEAIRTGVRLSRATVRTYKHNDMKDLQKILEGIATEDKEKKRDVLQQRRFIVSEGLFRNTGEICDLLQILKLKEKYFYRLILDDTQAFGALGKTGRGTTEHFGVKVTDVEIITFGMDCALASVGGVCIGTREVVDHQRLSGPGYCFSASACPFLSAAAKTALWELRDQNGLLDQLSANSVALARGLSNIKGMKLKANNNNLNSPLIHLQIDPELNLTKDEQKLLILRIARVAMEKGTGVTSCKFSLSDITNTAPSIRICASSWLSQAQISKSIADIAFAADSALQEVFPAGKGKGGKKNSL
jgi:serine palmitoyltransferase